MIFIAVKAVPTICRSSAAVGVHISVGDRHVSGAERLLVCASPRVTDMILTL